jgi:UDP-N-acetylmuramoyl-L-alanyl-D-glutamate--2,6-diaminopimelate ligase
MTWNDLTSQLAVRRRGGSGDPVVTNVTCDSRTAGPGSVYVSIPGFKVHGDTFIKNAVDKGASAVLSENPQPDCPVAWAQIGNARTVLGMASRAVYGIDLSKIRCVGITGTNGKTTTAHLLQALLSLVSGKNAVWMFGTIRYYAAGKNEAAHNTTPEAAEIFRDIAVADKKPDAIVMEVSSHSLALHRIAGLLYDCALFTNLTQDHLDFHASMEDYYQAKKMLFTDYLKPDGKAVINIDDPYGMRLAGELAEKPLVTFGRNESAGMRILDWQCGWGATTVTLGMDGRREVFSSKLAGFFNVYNMAAVAAAAQALGIGMDMVRRCFEAVDTVPGRMDRVPLDAPFSVFVDYAHTPDALVNVLSTAKNLAAGRLICVFGCGGDRDKTKRPLMGHAVAENADEAIVTSDNPRSEDPHAIVRDILRGMPLDFPHVVIIDRREAIRKALSMARPGDCVVVAGKGHEDYQEIKGVRHHFDDREEVLKAFTEAQAYAH